MWGTITNVESQGAIDVFTGGADADLFILGSPNQVFYNSIDGLTTDYAISRDLSTHEDTIQLHGSSADYQLTAGVRANVGGSNRSGVWMELSNGTSEAIAFIEGVSALDLNASYFEYVN